MSLDERFLSAIQALYDAGLDESQWPVALKQLAEVTGSQAATFWVLDGSDEPRLPTFTYINLDPAFVQEYLDSVAPLDPTVQYLVAHPNQPIVHDGIVITEREKDRHPYYDWHGRYSDLRFRMVGQVSPAPAVQAGVALHRTHDSGRYESPDLKRFDELYRHLKRALTIGFRLGSLTAVQNCTTELLHQNPSAILLLDSQKRVIYSNKAAEAIIAGCDGFAFLAGRLVLARREDQTKLERLLAHSTGGTMRVGRPSGKRHYLLTAAPIAGRYPALAMLKPAICVTIIDPESQRQLPVERLRTAFGLTAAEAALAAMLAAGEDLRAASSKLNITYGTARVRLAEIFQKTETRRQAELMKLLLSTLGAL